MTLQKNSEYDFVKFIGAGAQGKLSLVRHQRTKRLFVLKQIQLFGDPQDIQDSLQEVQILSKLDNPHVVRMYGGYVQAEDELHLLLEYCDAGSLDAFLEEKRHLSIEAMLYIAQQLLEGVFYLHSHGVAHLDIKPANILLMDKSSGPRGFRYTLLLGDFGLSRCMERGAGLETSLVGTIKYMSPEVLGRVGFGFPADIWSLGCVLFEVCFGTTPFKPPAYFRQQMFETVRRGRPNVRYEKKAVPKKLHGLIMEMLTPNPLKRPSARDLLRKLEACSAKLLRTLQETEQKSPKEHDVLVLGNCTQKAVYFQKKEEKIDTQIFHLTLTPDTIEPQTVETKTIEQHDVFLILVEDTNKFFKEEIEHWAGCIWRETLPDVTPLIGVVIAAIGGEYTMQIAQHCEKMGYGCGGSCELALISIAKQLEGKDACTAVV